jgi:hypothetical protein
MHCCCGTDVTPGRLIHGMTLHLKYRKVYDRNGAAEDGGFTVISVS